MNSVKLANILLIVVLVIMIGSIVFLTDTITQNKIISRSYYGQVFSNETIISKELVVQKKRQLCAGLTLLYEYNPLCI